MGLGVAADLPILLSPSLNSLSEHLCKSPILQNSTVRSSIRPRFHRESGPDLQVGAAMDDDKVIKGDKLILRGLKFHGFHGVKPEERKLGQKFLVDVDAWLDLCEAGKSDNLSDTISYTEIYRIVKEVVEGEAQNLLESVAHLIASTTLTKFPLISAVRVKVGKPHVAVPGPVDYLGVEILRRREDIQN
ncbi:dihydroneopterin aldolase 2-like isoform X2 [Diospyros lotus]|uniref:dihydroneopterin aldolase 2-like isoform X2 n=1 Tax=Diospyros lotus TaxID=55363 RepID=UPI00225738A6|nr:dihydroneopterin aldolase 2-like isoform X2 [Diospyros lotus]